MEQKIILIAAVDAARGIGQNNDLVVKSRVDMKHFMETTLGHPVIMGMKTFQSMDNFLLKDRYNIILTRSTTEVSIRQRSSDTGKKNFLITSLDRLMSEHFMNNPQLQCEKIFVIGGEEIYKLFLPAADEIILTEFAEATSADKFFPNFKNLGFEKTSIKNLNDPLHPGNIVTYVRNKQLNNSILFKSLLN